MDSKKLAKVIKIVVEQELKKQLPRLVKEGVARVLSENQKSKKMVVSEEQDVDPFDIANQVLENERRKAPIQESTQTQPAKRFSKNETINEILNNTTPFKQGSALDENNSHSMDKTVSFDNNTAPGGKDAMRVQMAAKMGYGDMGGGAQPNGLGVQTGNPVLDKAMNRDYSALVKKFKTR